jgi:cytochrome c biogenesis protein CcmG/thiol:disulfide interchange protein DsbE
MRVTAIDEPLGRKSLSPCAAARQKQHPENDESPDVIGAFSEAGDGGRTRDLRLGKPTLYQLSYTRVGPGSLAAGPGPCGAGAAPAAIPCAAVTAARRRPVVPVVVGLLATALVALLVYGVVHGGDNTTLDDAVKQGSLPTAPGADLKRPLLDGSGSASLADYKGKIVVLNFWASWCEPCIAEAPVLQRAQRDLEKRGDGTVFGATYQDASDASQKFEREHKITYPSVRDVDVDLAHKYGTNKLPETFVINRQGKIVAISRGQISEKFLTAAIAKARRS